MKAKHTPGPWEVDSGMVQTAREVLSSGLHIPIARMDREPGNGTLPVERDANAQLIAAAPELLEALKAMQTASDEIAVEFITRKRATNWGIVNDAYLKAERAITKAEGC